jgi:hypothetical protein
MGRGEHRETQRTVGVRLRSNVLDPLRAAGAGSQFVTDCLTTYRLSTGAAARLDDTYELMAKDTSGLRSADLQPHPSEAQIVREALEIQAERLNTQIEAARPKVIVNAWERRVAGDHEPRRRGGLGKPSGRWLWRAFHRQHLGYRALVDRAGPSGHAKGLAGSPPGLASEQRLLVLTQ